LNEVPEKISVTIKSHWNLFPHWRERLRRGARLETYISDIGAVNPRGDSAATDPVATLELAARCHSQAMARLDEEVSRLTEQGTEAVLCDAPAVPLVAARRAGVPAYLMSNFTWVDIYAPYARSAGAGACRFVSELRDAYKQATGTFRIAPAMRMSWLASKRDCGMVVGRARNRRAELLRQIGSSGGHKLVYLYVGRYGQSTLEWSRLAQFAARGIHFVSHHPGPADVPANFHVVPSPDWPGGDLIASSDAVLAKAGYGTVCEAMAAGTPMIYPPRRGFAEFRSLDRALRSWPGGVPVSSRDFATFNLKRALQRALETDPGPPPFPADGARRIAGYLMAHCRATGSGKASAIAL
jgi:hypothetical protein